MKYYPSPSGALAMVAPVGCQQKMDSDFLAISSSDGSVSITDNTFSKNGGHFEAFAEYCFSSV
ncbi:hypothetical protein [Marinomonas spartinae]|uniref:hypothetical protein n=1 Tax=Marinomonas spartinae TaxID=1792290 RepID=UPI0018F14088|nr:hypothetical protein [Marinomonas spartinae]MBJ7555525.1 hypothetical protein [Marinomonas spartinae]